MHRRSAARFAAASNAAAAARYRVSMIEFPRPVGVDRALDEALHENEVVLWSGAPKTGLAFRAFDLLLVPFAFIWTSFPAGLVISAVSTHEGDSWSPLTFAAGAIPLLFLCIGLYISVGRFFTDAFVRSRTRYLLTNERALVASGLFSTEVRSIFLESVVELSTKTRGSRGRLLFGEDPSAFSGSRNPWAPWAGGPIAFDLIADPRPVYDLAMEARRRLRERG